MKIKLRSESNRLPGGSTPRRSLSEWFRGQVDRSKATVAGEVQRRREALASGNKAMLAAAEEPVRRGTKKRALVPIVAGGAVLVVMFQAVAMQILAVNFTTMNDKMRLYSNYLDASKAASFLSPSKQQDGSNVGVAELGIVTAKLAGLCVIKEEDIPLVGTYSFMITAGDAIQTSYTNTGLPTGYVEGTDVNATTGSLIGTRESSAIKADNLFINATGLTGFGNKLSGMNLGQNAADVSGSSGANFGAWPDQATNYTPTAGNFGLYIDRLNVAGLNGQGYGMNLKGSITLPKLNLRVLQGTKAQGDCAA